LEFCPELSQKNEEEHRMKNIGNPWANVIFSCSEEIHQKGKALGLEESFDKYSMLPSLYIHMDSMHRQIQWGKIESTRRVQEFAVWAF
jgi:hypothetical protein